jgi:class 3 adenylate cyclase/CHASE2 domain-containing sensor protein
MSEQLDSIEMNPMLGIDTNKKNLFRRVLAILSNAVRKYMFLIIPVACLFAIAASEPLWDHVEFKAYDARVQLCRHFDIGHSRPSGKVVMVGIEELAALKKKPFIFWYPDLGRFLTIAAQAKAKAIGIDIIPFHSLEQKLADSFKGMSGDVPKTAVLDDIGKQLDNALVSGLMQASRKTEIIQGVSGSLVPFYYDLMAFMENVKPASLRVEADHDGVLRMEARSLEKEQVGFVAQLYSASGAKAPVQEQFRINFSLIDRIPVYSFEEIISGSFDVSKLKDKLIILGMYSKHEDIHETPLGMRPGSLIHATGLETLLTDTAITAPGMTVSLGILAVLCFSAFPPTRFRQPFLSFCCICGIMAAYFVVNMLVFSRYVALPLFPHIMAPLVIYSASYLYRFIVEERSKRQLYQTFSYYVEPQVIDQLVTQDPSTLMRGERRDVCIMFLDIRGFTALSEKISSELLVSMLNVFFGRVSEIVQDNHGFVNKFIGDGMLAFFAVGDRYVDDALQASREICLATEQLNQSGEFTPMIGENRLAIGIGLHNGSVILGNIGSNRKMDFTVIGPPVNTASRIESLTKQYAREILVSNTVQSAASEHFTFDSLGRAEVKGIDGGVEIFALKI